MAIFLTEAERSGIRVFRSDPVYSNLYWGLLNRVRKYAASPSLECAGTDTEWPHHVLEYLTDAALVCAVAPEERLKTRLRHAALDVAELPLDDWIGPFFRDHTATPPRGHLETAHYAAGLAIVADLVPELFRAEEAEIIRGALREKAVPLCREWLRWNDHLMNWRCILLSGLAVAGAVLRDETVLDEVSEEYRFCLNAVQPDGSYGESLQYSNYCFRGLMLTYEALLRSGRNPGDMPYAKAVRWFRHSLLYNKPLSGWGEHPRPRSLNFNDSAALFGPDPDLLMHIAVRAGKEMPAEAATARELFDELYAATPAQGPFDRSSFGFLNRYGFLSVVLYPQSAAAAPEKAGGEPPWAAFSNGDRIARNSWENPRTILGFRAGSEYLNAPGHLHEDANSLILAYAGERLLVDPGHCCYRNWLHHFDLAAGSHNTCVFRCGGTELGQKGTPGRRIGPGRTLSPALPRGGRPLLAGRCGSVTIFANDAAEAYGAPIRRFERFALLCGEHVLFLVDRIESSEPVTAIWNWLLNNRDGELEWKLLPPDRLVARRGPAGMKLFHIGAADDFPQGPFYGHVHDAYHPLPGQKGEGAPGSGLQFRWQERSDRTSRRVVHAIALDDYGPVTQWHLQTGAAIVLKGRAEEWALAFGDSGEMLVSEKNSGESVRVVETAEKWSMFPA